MTTLARRGTLKWNEAWYPYWAWEHFQYGFFDNDPRGLGPDSCVQQRKEFFITPNLFEETAIAVMREWPVCCEHFLTGEKTGKISFLGQVSAFYHSGVGAKYSYAYNQMEKKERIRNNAIAKKLIERWSYERESEICNGLYCRVEKKRLREGYTARLPRFVELSGVSSIIQGDLFSNTK